MKGVQVMAAISLQCNSLSQIHSSQAEDSMTGRTYIWPLSLSTVT